MAEEDEFELPMPLGGVSDDLAFSRQDLRTTRDAANVRSQDRRNGRERISQRSGMSKANDAQVDASNRVLELASVVYDSRNLEYSHTPGQESEEWSTAAPSKGTVFHLASDRQGNVYFTDGTASIAKLNADGVLAWALPLPIKDKGHSIRFVHVDDVFDVYTGVSAGTRSDLGQLWKITQLPEDEAEIAWEANFEAFVETAKVYRDKLYALLNDPLRGLAAVRVFDSLDAAAPAAVQEFIVPYPAHDMDISEAGDIFVASAEPEPGPAFLVNRLPDPKFPTIHTEAQDWTPHDLTEAPKRIWSWFEADDISEFDVSGPFEDGAKILRWPDRSKNNRHLYAATSIGKKPPTLAMRGWGSHRAVRFNGVDQALISLSNASTTLAAADQQKTALPAYVDSMFCTIMVVRPEKRTSGNPMFIFGQDNLAAGATDHILIANRSDGSSLPGTFAAGLINHYAATAVGDPGQGTNGHPLEATFDNDSDAAIVVVLWDGGIEGGDTTKTRSLFQLNGKPIDRYQGLGNTATSPTIVGWWTNPSSGIDHLSGDILAWITLDRQDRTTLTEPKVLTHDQLETGGPTTDQTDNELTRIVGYFAHRFGLHHLLPPEPGDNGHPYGPQSETLGALGSQAISGPPDAGQLGAHGKSQRRFGLLAKYDPRGRLVWVANDEDFDPDDPTNNAVGFGLGVRVDKDGNLFSIGETFDGLATIDQSTRFLRKVIDQGDDFSLLVADGAWSVTIDDPTYRYPRMAVDPFGNVYVPLHSEQALRVYKGSDGTQLAEFDFSLTAISPVAVAIDPRIPDYEGDLTDELARFVYVAGLPGAEFPPIVKVRLVQESPITGSPRTLTNIAISAGGLIKTFDVGGASMATPTGAVGALSTTPVYVQSVPAFSKLYITDSISKIQVFDPRENTVTFLESSTPGSPPHGAKLLERFQGRLFAARAPGLIGGAFDWAAARDGEPTDWNNFPVTRDAAAAIAGENEFGPGMCPDIVNSLIPMDDDFLLFGCDHSIWMLSGNPGDGGQFDLVSDITGIAFGRPWCKDPEGRVWFVGSRGGLFVIPPGGRPLRISENNIDERLNSIDFATHYVRLAWNDRDKGVHIHRYPFGTPGDPVEHWFWDKKRGAPWPDTFGTTEEPEIEPTAIYVVDGDNPDDRVVLLGGRDGYVRKWDKDANDDDAFPIDAHVLIGPLVGPEASREMRFQGPRVVLASDQDGAEFQLYATDDPAQLGVVRHAGPLHPGRNAMKRARMRGSYCFVRIRNSVAGQGFAIEEAAMKAYPGGLKRVRQTP